MVLTAGSDQAPDASRLLQIITEDIKCREGVHPINLAFAPQCVYPAEIGNTRLPTDTVDDSHDELRRLANCRHLLNLPDRVSQLGTGAIKALGRNHDLGIDRVRHNQITGCSLSVASGKPRSDLIRKAEVGSDRFDLVLNSSTRDAGLGCSDSGAGARNEDVAKVELLPSLRGEYANEIKLLVEPLDESAGLGASELDPPAGPEGIAKDVLQPLLTRPCC